MLAKVQYNVDMSRAARKSVKFVSYALTALIGAVLVMFGLQARSESKITDGALPVQIADTAFADHVGDNVGDTVNPPIGRQGDDDDDGGGPDGGGG